MPDINNCLRNLRNISQRRNGIESRLNDLQRYRNSKWKCKDFILDSFLSNLCHYNPDIYTKIELPSIGYSLLSGLKFTVY